MSFGSNPIDPDKVQLYLESKLGGNLSKAELALMKLSKAYKPDVLAKEAYSLDEIFHPKIADGVKNWGAKGDLGPGADCQTCKMKVKSCRGIQFRVLRFALGHEDDFPQPCGKQPAMKGRELVPIGP